MATKILSKHKRVQQWATFARIWYLYDAKWQNPFDSADLIAKYLTGQHKPIFHPMVDAGDHVVVINAKDIAMPSTEWRYRMYYHHTLYRRGESWTAAWELHNKDPTKVIWKAIYKACGTSLKRHAKLAKCHIFPDDKIPPDIRANISDQIRPLRPVPKKVGEYTKEQLEEFPKLFDWPVNYCKK